MKIELPCTENFSGMQKNKLGRHCELCNKTVVDFTKQSNEQIINYLSQANENVCGRFKSFQIEQKTGFEKFVFVWRESIFKRVQFKPIRLMLLGLLSGITAFTSSCMGKAMEKEPKPEKQNAQVDSVKYEKKN